MTSGRLERCLMRAHALVERAHEGGVVQARDRRHTVAGAGRARDRHISRGVLGKRRDTAASGNIVRHGVHLDAIDVHHHCLGAPDEMSAKEHHIPSDEDAGWGGVTRHGCTAVREGDNKVSTALVVDH